jgi:hypothetical protein
VAHQSLCVKRSRAFIRCRKWWRLLLQSTTFFGFFIEFYKKWLIIIVTTTTTTSLFAESPNVQSEKLKVESLRQLNICLSSNSCE